MITRMQFHRIFQCIIDSMIQPQFRINIIIRYGVYFCDTSWQPYSRLSLGIGQICAIIILCFEKRWSNLKLDIFFQDPDQNVAECVDKKRFFMDKK